MANGGILGIDILQPILDLLGYDGPIYDESNRRIKRNTYRQRALEEGEDVLAGYMAARYDSHLRGKDWREGEPSDSEDTERLRVSMGEMGDRIDARSHETLRRRMMRRTPWYRKPFVSTRLNRAKRDYARGIALWGEATAKDRRQEKIKEGLTKLAMIGGLVGGGIYLLSNPEILGGIRNALMGPEEEELGPLREQLHQYQRDEELREQVQAQVRPLQEQLNQYQRQEELREYFRDQVEPLKERLRQYQGVEDLIERLRDQVRDSREQIRHLYGVIANFSRYYPQGQAAGATT